MVVGDRGDGCWGKTIISEGVGNKDIERKNQKLLNNGFKPHL